MENFFSSGNFLSFPCHDSCAIVELLIRKISRSNCPRRQASRKLSGTHSCSSYLLATETWRYSQLELSAVFCVLHFTELSFNWLINVAAGVRMKTQPNFPRPHFVCWMSESSMFWRKCISNFSSQTSELFLARSLHARFSGSRPVSTTQIRFICARTGNCSISQAFLERKRQAQAFDELSK